MSHSSEDPGHGHSLASWTTVIVVVVAFAIGALFFFLENPPFVYASAGLALAGVIAGFVLRKMGYGVGGQHTKSH